MTLNDKLLRLGKHYKIPAGNMSTKDWVAAIRKAAGKGEFMNIDTLYSDAFGSADKHAPKQIEAKAVEVKEVPQKLPALQPMTIDGAKQQVDVAAPSLVFHLAPASITVKAGDVDWSHTLHRIGVHLFTLAAGIMLGVLLSKSVLKMVGIG